MMGHKMALGAKLKKNYEKNFLRAYNFQIGTRRQLLSGSEKWTER